MAQRIEQALARLQKSRFRSGFHLSEADRAYVRAKGRDAIRLHAEQFIRERLAPSEPEKDGRQTPWRGHPVFVAMHACGCCCRGCLNQWYRVKKGVPLTEEQQKKIVNLLMAWIDEEMKQEKAGSAAGPTDR